MNPSAPPIVSHRLAATHRGLALVELVIILVVLAVIAIVTVPRLGRAETDRPEVSMRGDLAVLRNAIELYAADHGGAYPPLKGFETALTRPLDGHGPYLQAIPGRPAERSGNAQAPRVAALALPGPGPSSTLPIGEPAQPLSPHATWLYDQQTGQIQPHAPADR